MTVSRDLVEQLLDFIETKETKLLSWGFFDGAFSALELENEVANNPDQTLYNSCQDVSANGWSMSRILDEAANNSLLYQLPDTDAEPRYRSRFAEGVRLISRLKQRFSHIDWQSAPNLVSDLKVDLRPRVYPDFDQSPDACWADLESSVRDLKIQRAVFECMSRKSDGTQMPFAGFQRRSFKRIFENYKKPSCSGTVICAGTGSGKTKSFYIPALLSVVGDIIENDKPFTKIIAIYPRNVLLTDQLREAVAEIIKISPILEENNLRSITIGALCGYTPSNANSMNAALPGQFDYADRFNKWSRVEDGRVCALLKSPIDGISDLVWRDDDRKNGSSALYNRDNGQSMAPDVPSKILVLTREDIIKEPPDILFLSADMLNREMGSPEWSKVFGFGVKKINSIHFS